MLFLFQVILFFFFTGPSVLDWDLRFRASLVLLPEVSFLKMLLGPPAHCISTPGSRSFVDLGPG